MDVLCEACISMTLTLVALESASTYDVYFFASKSKLVHYFHAGLLLERSSVFSSTGSGWVF